MPELPEVEVVRRGLVEHIVGRTIATTTVTGHRVARRHPAGPADLSARVSGRTVLAADRRGKYLWLVLGRDHDEPPADEPTALVIHLGMSGQLLVQPPGADPVRHTHAVFAFADGDSVLRFVDQRTFGGLSLVPLVPDQHARGGRAPGEHAQGGTPTTGMTHRYGIPASVVHVAADPLEPTYDEGAVIRALKMRHTAIKRALLDQRLVSGIGNIYADEALWRAQVHGRRTCDALSKPTLARVLQHAQEVMSQALLVGGTSFDALYVNVNGASGYFDRSLDAYGQTDRPCSRCETPIRREEFMNRSSHFCPRCQPVPRPMTAVRR
ncbi:MAG: bifunctional DNA-formamidopyrimidine glycosylase/DNA-(apurinic or apyrimidinic site) lyase [Ornithinimicrobium sp.]